MSNDKRIPWVEPKIINLEQLPLTLGACADGNTVASGVTTGGGTTKCISGNTAGKNQCNLGNNQV